MGHQAVQASNLAKIPKQVHSIRQIPVSARLYLPHMHILHGDDVSTVFGYPIMKDYCGEVG